MNVAIGCDEAGYALKETLKAHLAELGHDVADYGVGADETILYPDIAFKVAEAVQRGDHSRAVLICGTGIGVCISANKVANIRAAQVHDTYSAERAQLSNNAQIVCLGARVVGAELAKSIVDSYMAVTFKDGRSTEKVERIASYEAEVRAHAPQPAA